MAELVALKKRRAYIKGSMTKLLNFINSIGSATNSEDIKVRLVNVERYRNEFIEVENKIVALDDDEEIDTIFEDNYYKVVAGLNLALRTRTEKALSHDASIDMSMTGGHMEVKLPKIAIPTFEGDYTEWQSFHDLFCSTIHDNQRLTPSQKLQYLKGSLKGEASGLLKHFSITDANYIEALRKLRERYDRRKHTIYAFIKSFMLQPTVTTPNSANVRQLLDTSDEIIRGLKALGEDAETRDHWLIHIMICKLDNETISLWAQASAEFDLPNLKQFFDFLTKRIDALESLKGQHKRVQPPTQSKSTIRAHVITDLKAESCSVCGAEHKLFECQKFKEMTVNHRRDLLINTRRCFNCLNNNHSVYNCKSKFRCKICNRKHHSLIHVDSIVTSESNVAQPESPLNDTNKLSLTASTGIASSILPTVLVRVTDGSDQKQFCRALLDSGSQGSFISERCAQRLQLKRTNAKIAITGIGATSSGYTKGSVSLSLTPWSKDEPCLQLEALIFPKLTAKQPSISRFIDIEYFKQYELADPYFYKSREIDMIIGADSFFEILTEGKMTTNNQLIMQNTLLGWIIAGKTSESQAHQVITISLNNPEDNLENLLKRFWEIEAVESTSKLSQEERLCENLFKGTTTTESNGRFKVRLPFKRSPTILGDSYRIAAKRLHAMEKKFVNQEDFGAMYKQFMNEYIELDHMKAVGDDKLNHDGYYLPHHAVTKNSSTTTKLRVVFDGSAKTNKGVSLNDCLAVGPIVQSTLYQILCRFRMFKVAISADVEKMFRQVLVAQEDTRYQRILWRDSPEKPFVTYELQTVTYGTASATYLATRALNQAAENYQEVLPKAVNHIRNSFYVDDLMAGADSIEEAVSLKDEIDKILKSCGFKLRKWLSNEPSVLVNNQHEPTQELHVIEIDESHSVKVLGLHWDPAKDCFKFRINLNQNPTITKRGILSEASRLFDPLGWLAPITIGVKIFFQTLWTRNLQWDDKLPSELANEWLNLRDGLLKVEKIELERYIQTNAKSTIVLHGFSDASKHAYSAVVYGQIINANGKSIIKLLSAKTKVAPVKQVSIPRLELCGALLLNRLILSVKEALQFDAIETNAWTDSTIVLDWLSSHPTRWNTFVGNRTGEILNSMSRSQWRHVQSKDNPADCASRGIEPDKLQNFNLWWNGPTWLSNREKWPKNQVDRSNTTMEERSQSLNIQLPESDIIGDLIKNISSFTKITKILAYILRFIDIKLRRIHQNRMPQYLTSKELQKSERSIFKYVQMKHFQLEIKLLESRKELPASSKIKGLNPFIDESGLLRVGGRISNASITYNIKHPIILPARDDLTISVVREHHIRYLHAGPTLMMATLRHKYWILGCRRLIRKIVHECVKCMRYSGKELKQIMGDLPNPRVELVRPFLKVGVDYAGPFQTCLVRGRGQKTRKSYACIFVCLATKAVHIELASDLTTESYIAALRRFIARRGICKEIYSDNGTNFIGARNHLHELFKFLKQNANTFSKFLLTDHIEFKFSPPSAPHFGGLWEAAVKGMKYHLRRVTDGHRLTIEEMSTLFAEIEAMLNSRPICILSSDDLDYLTPAHFLIGRPTIRLPGDDLADIKISKLSRWQMVQKMNQHIWKRWHQEYLTNLQHRSKWHQKQGNIQINDIVLIKETNLPPSKWLMAKVMEIHPGTDDIVRVVTLKTTNGIVKRPIHKLCLLPVS